jgi:methionine-rich copper-binding protein CopC
VSRSFRRADRHGMPGRLTTKGPGRLLGVLSRRIHRSRLSRSRNRSLTAVLGAIAGALLVAASTVVIAAPAQAHDELVSADPASGTTADALPAQLTLTFSGVLSAGPGASEVSVTDAAGTSLTDGAPVVADTVLTQPLAGEASGVVTVLWKVVSSDGHPISGEYSFTVTAAASPSQEPTASPTPSEEPSETATPTATTVVPEDPDMDAIDMRPWFIGALLLLLAVAGAVIYLLVSRGRREAALGSDPGTPSDPSEPGSSPGSGPPAGR